MESAEQEPSRRHFLKLLSLGVAAAGMVPITDITAAMVLPNQNKLWQKKS